MGRLDIKVTREGATLQSKIDEYIAEIPTSTLDEMLTAGADILEPEIRRNAETMLNGAYSTGATARSVKRKEPETTDRGRRLIITFDGKRTDKHHPRGIRNAEVAFLNEYGARKIPARPFIKRAIEDRFNAVTDAVEKVFDEWFKTI